MPYQSNMPHSINYSENGGRLELPVSGATGWAAVSTSLLDEPSTSANAIARLTPGQGFSIIAEQGDWWNVCISGADSISGWILHHSSFINLPDVIPSLVFDVTNAYASVKRSSGYEIPNITGYALYNSRTFNTRLDRYAFIVPVLYSTAIRIFEAQQAALADGNTIIMYEAFRPRAAQQNVVYNLRRLMDSNARVRNAINAAPWGLTWFIATGTSNHQRGVAVDVGLGRVISYETRLSGVFSYKYITAFERFAMPTPIHELSPMAAVFTRPVASSSVDAWRTTTLASTMTEGAKLLQRYLIDAGFTPLASEWWHFNDLEGRAIANDAGINGDFFTESIYSNIPISLGGDAENGNVGT
jgi:D-alanyl-D-alanine dipeptidase